MVQEYEVVTLLVATAGLIFVLLNIRALARVVPSWCLMFGAMVALYSGWCLTVLENLHFSESLNLLEHAAYMVSTLLLAAWSIRALVFTGSVEP